MPPQYIKTILPDSAFWECTGMGRNDGLSGWTLIRGASEDALTSTAGERSGIWRGALNKGDCLTCRDTSSPPFRLTQGDTGDAVMPGRQKNSLIRLPIAVHCSSGRHSNRPTYSLEMQSNPQSWRAPSRPLQHPSWTLIGHPGRWQAWKSDVLLKTQNWKNYLQHHFVTDTRIRMERITSDIPGSVWVTTDLILGDSVWVPVVAWSGPAGGGG